jgi:hypothetical protein
MNGVLPGYTTVEIPPPGFEPGSPALDAKYDSDSTATDEWSDRKTNEAVPVSEAPSCSLCPGMIR